MSVKRGELCIPKNNLKVLTDEWKALQGTEVDYEVPVMQPAIDKKHTICLVKVNNEVRSIPLSWIKDHFSDLLKGYRKNKVYQHVDGHRIINSGIGVGIQTPQQVVGGSKSWQCTGMHLDGFLKERKFSAKDYKEAKKETK